MNFVNALEIIFSQDLDNEEIILNLEEIISQKFTYLYFEISHKGIILYNINYQNNEKITFKDYIEEGKFFKNFLFENNLANNENYSQFFKIRTIDFSQNEEKKDDLDKYIAKVDENDEKLLDVMNQLKNLGKK